MAYRQFTQCVSANGYIGSAAVYVIYGAAVGALPVIYGLIFLGLAAGPAALAAMTVPLLAIIAYCHWWLYGRLICLGADVCAVGRLLTVETPENKTGLDQFDTDYSINLILAPHGIGALQGDVESDGIQGGLMMDQPGVIARKLPFTGETAQFFKNDPTTAVLHCEFEGGGVYDVMNACLAALGFNTVAFVAACIICAIPVIGWLACLFISLALAAITAAIVAQGAANALNDKGNPNDVDSNLGNLEQLEDLLVVHGTWTYDTAHSGWNEIHPIKQCQRIGKWTGFWGDQFVGIPGIVSNQDPVAPADVRTYVKLWCDAITKANDPFTVAEQKQPQNQWEIHPVIDGCNADDQPPPPK